MLSEKNQTNDFYVYLHLRADDGLPFYVGKGRNGRAWFAHGRTPNWQRIVAKHGLLVEILKDSMSESESFEFEKSTIQLLGRGFLCNCTDGGEGMSGHVKSAETLAKLRASLIGRRHSEKTKALIGAKSKGRIVSSETRNKLAAANRGKLPSSETLVKRAIALRGRKFSEDHKSKISAALTGRKCLPEHTEKAAAACRVGVICSNGMKFGSVKWASDWLRLNGFPKAIPSNISQCCRGKLGAAYGFTWSYDATDEA